MKVSTYPNTVGVPKLALIGASGAGKSTLALKLLPRGISAAAKIAGDSSAQTTLIPTHFYIKHDPNDQHEHDLTLCATLHPVSSDGAFRIDEDAVYTAVQHNIVNFATKSKGTGVPIADLHNYINSGNFSNDICSVVNGAVRLKHFAEDENFRTCAKNCASALLEGISISEIDSSVSKMKGDTEKVQAKALALRDQLRYLWDEGRKEASNAVYILLKTVDSSVRSKLKNLVPDIECFNTFSFDLSNENDRVVFTQLLDPYSPFSLIVEKYEIACGMSATFQKVFHTQQKEGNWLDERLPFRLVLMDTVGLDQDNANELDVANRLRSALNSGCQGILLMLPPSLKDKEKRTIQRRFSAETDEGRRIRRNEIPLFLGVARADEEVTPTVDFEDDAEAYSQEMCHIWDKLSNASTTWREQFRAEDTRFITNQPKKIKAYLDDLKEVNSDLANMYEKHLGTESTLLYLFDIVVKLQRQLFLSEKPIFFRAVHEELDSLHIDLKVISRDVASEMAASLADVSKKYYVSQWLHWNTAYAFRSATFGGYHFISRAVQNGRISIFIRGDVDKTARATQWKVIPNIELRNIILDSPESTSLKENLGITSADNIDDDVKRGLYELFKTHFIGSSSWRFWRAIDATVSRLSYTEPKIRNSANQAFEKGLWDVDANEGVVRMLNYYRNLYQDPDFADTISTILNEELSKEFNNFFYPLYT